MVNPVFKKYIWTFAFIAGILMFISIFTPIVSLNWDIFIWGGISIYDWIGNKWIFFLMFGFYLIVSMSMSIPLLLIYSSLTYRGQKFRWAWLIYIIIGFSNLLLSILVWYEIWFINQYISLIGYDIGFTSIGSVIAGILSVGAGILEKIVKVDDRKELTLN